MTGVVLLYVGVVLIVNGIWLIGQARAAAAARLVPARETAAVGSTIRGGGYAGEAAAGQELGGEAVTVPPPRGAEAHPLFIQNREGIGRASGREKGEISGVAGSLKKKNT